MKRKNDDTSTKFTDKFTAARSQLVGHDDPKKLPLILDGNIAAGLICWPFVGRGQEKCGCDGRLAHLWPTPAFACGFHVNDILGLNVNCRRGKWF